MEFVASERRWQAARALQRQLDLAVGRAMIDQAYAKRLLADPSVALGEADCAPAQRRTLSKITSSTLPELAEALVSQFWGTSPATPLVGLQLADAS